MVQERDMKRLFEIALLALAVMYPTITYSASTDAAKNKPQLTICKGEYALCAASTCEPTGKTITTNNGNVYPEVVCRCPILKGPAIADLSAGNMQGSCAAAEGHVWSLFFPRLHYPQEASGFSRNPQDMKAKIQLCGAGLNQGANASNCFSFDCERGKDGIAVCKCPMAQVTADTAFLTEAGQGNPQACYQHPVSLPLGK